MADYRIWPATNGSDNGLADSSVNLGVEFYVTSTCWIKGFRFFQPTGGSPNTAVRDVGLFPAGGGAAIAGTTTTLNPGTGGGWKEVLLATPVALVTNTRYRAVVRHPSGGYTATTAYFVAGGGGASDIVNGPLVCVNAANAVSNKQGSYKYGATLQWTEASSGDANYWTDVIITDTDPAAGTTTGTLSAPVPRATSSVAGVFTATTTGALSSPVPRATSSAAGTVTAPAGTGTLAASLPRVTSNAAGTAAGPVFTGTMSAPVPRVTASMAETTKLTIAQENALTGNALSEWAIAGAGDTANVGFAREFSTNVGNTVQFSCSGTGTVIDVYRLGWYGGLGSRKVATLTNTATSQPAATTIANSNGCVTCTAWSVTATWAVPSNHTPGLHVAVYRNTGQTNASWIPFVVRDDARVADIIVKTSDSTWGSAYNGYGGRSLYGQTNATGTAWVDSGIEARGHAMDYHRPIMTRGLSPLTYWDNAEQPLIAHLERNGYDVKYVSSMDLDTGGARIAGAKVLVSSGHDEYWTQGMRDNAIAARNAGTHLVFMSGNEVFWRTRLVGSTQWCYKDTMAGPGAHVAGAALDPVSWTGTWRDVRRPGGAEPENQLTGTFFRFNSANALTPTLSSATYGSHVVWRNSALTSADVTLTQAVGFEADEMVPLQPAGSRTTLAGQTFNIDGLRADDNGEKYNTNGSMAWGIVAQRYASGALVVGFGTIQWAWTLNNLHQQGAAYAHAAAQQMTYNLLRDLGTAPVTPMAGITTSAPASLSSYGAVPGEETGTLSAPVPRATSSVAGSVTAPVFTGGVTASVPVVTGSMTGTAAGPAFTGNLGASTPKVTGSAAGTASAPVYTGTVAASTPRPSSTMGGTATGPVFTGTLTALTPATTAAMSGAVTVPDGSASLSAPVPLTTATMAGGVTAPVYTGALSAVAPVVAGSLPGSSAVPSSSGVLSAPIPPTRTTMSGTVAAPVYTGAVAAGVPRVRAVAPGVVVGSPSDGVPVRGPVLTLTTVGSILSLDGE